MSGKEPPGAPGTVGRRRMLRTAAVAGAGGIGAMGAVVATPSPAEAHQQSLQVIDVRAHGAIGDGVADDRAAIQSALNEVSSNSRTPNVVHFPAGDYAVSGPLVPKPNTLMWGTHTTDVVGDYDPPSQCRITVRSNFSGTALIMPGSDITGLTIRNLALVGRGIGTGIAGIRFPSTAPSEQATTLEDVTISAFSGDGIAGRISVLSMIQCMVVRNKGWGINGSGRWTDGHITGCYFSFNETGNLLFGPSVSGLIEVANTRVERAGGDPVAVGTPVNPSAPGIRITGGASLRFTNVTTDANMGHGVEIVHDATSPAYQPNHIQFANCAFTRDGTGNQQSASAAAGVKVAGNGPNGQAVQSVLFVNCSVSAGRADDDNPNLGIMGPKYGVWFENTTFFQWIGGDVLVHSDDHPGGIDYHTGVGNNYRPTLVDIPKGLMTLPLDPPSLAIVPDGSTYVERGDGSTPSRLMVRLNGGWKSATLT